MKRLDQWLSGNDVKTYSYILKAEAVLEPDTEGLPTLRFPNSKEYWNQFAQGSTHSFDLLHGPLKLWQLDHSKLDQHVREFYNRQGG